MGAAEAAAESPRGWADSAPRPACWEHPTCSASSVLPVPTPQRGGSASQSPSASRGQVGTGSEPRLVPSPGRREVWGASLGPGCGCPRGGGCGSQLGSEEVLGGTPGLPYPPQGPPNARHCSSAQRFSFGASVPHLCLPTFSSSTGSLPTPSRVPLTLCSGGFGTLQGTRGATGPCVAGHALSVWGPRPPSLPSLKSQARWRLGWLSGSPCGLAGAG